MRFFLIPEDVACWLPDTLAVVIRQKTESVTEIAPYAVDAVNKYTMVW